MTAQIYLIIIGQAFVKTQGRDMSIVGDSSARHRVFSSVRIRRHQSPLSEKGDTEVIASESTMQRVIWQVWFASTGLLYLFKTP